MRIKLLNFIEKPKRLDRTLENSDKTIVKMLEAEINDSLKVLKEMFPL